MGSCLGAAMQAQATRLEAAKAAAGVELVVVATTASRLEAAEAAVQGTCLQAAKAAAGMELVVVAMAGAWGVCQTVEAEHAVPAAVTVVERPAGCLTVVMVHVVQAVVTMAVRQVG